MEQPVLLDVPAIPKPSKKEDDTGWELDTDKSFARLEVTPLKIGESVIFCFDEAAEIRPYPNPRGYGGMCGHGSVQTEADVKKLITRFRRYNAQWVKLGMKLEITRYPEMTPTEYSNAFRGRQFEEKDKDNGNENGEAGLAQLMLV